MAEHFCTCYDKSCDKHPSQHNEGCDPCIKKNLERGEIPSCFWISIGGDLSNEKEFTIKHFVDYFLRSKS